MTTHIPLQQIKSNNDIYDLLKSRNICAMFNGKTKHKKSFNNRQHRLSTKILRRKISAISSN